MPMIKPRRSGFLPASLETTGAVCAAKENPGGWIDNPIPNAPAEVFREGSSILFVHVVIPHAIFTAVA